MTQPNRQPNTPTDRELAQQYIAQAENEIPREPFESTRNTYLISGASLIAAGMLYHLQTRLGLSQHHEIILDASAGMVGSVGGALAERRSAQDTLDALEEAKEEGLNIDYDGPRIIGTHSTSREVRRDLKGRAVDLGVSALLGTVFWSSVPWSVARYSARRNNEQKELRARRAMEIKREAEQDVQP